VGRDAERVLLSGFLDAGGQTRQVPAAGDASDGDGVPEAGSTDGHGPESGSTEAVAAILTGPAGIGKTAL
jgi:hypothetical protein